MLRPNPSLAQGFSCINLKKMENAKKHVWLLTVFSFAELACKFVEKAERVIVNDFVKSLSKRILMSAVEQFSEELNG
jgi:hypothetical protein